MPAFNPLAGFSPSCCAVFLQMEHCSKDAVPEIKKETINNNATNLFMTCNYPQNYIGIISKMNKIMIILTAHVSL